MNRTRLSAAYVAIMLAGLLVFAAAAVFAIDRTERSALDARLATNARAAAQFADVKDGRVHLDAEDVRQIPQVIGQGMDAAVVGPHGSVLFTTAHRMLPFRPGVPSANPRFFSAGHGDAKLRVYAAPVLHRGMPVGALLVWAGSDWIDETARNLGIALGALAVVIAVLALLAGNVVTRRALEDAFARQRRFTADASHELRAPLAVIRAEADLALRREREPAAYRSAIETIAAEADHMEALIGDLLSAARAESGSLTRERVDVGRLLGGVANRLKPAAAAKDARIHVEACDGASILADANALERALLAIGHNAVKYAPQHGSVTLSCGVRERTVDVLVRDSGPGFSTAALEHGLERFWREPGSPAGSGTGLGLAIARSIVEANGGSITLANAGSGAQVHLRFPAI